MVNYRYIIFLVKGEKTKMSRLLEVNPNSGEIIRGAIKSSCEKEMPKIEVGSTVRTMDSCNVKILKIENDIAYVQISSNELRRDMSATITINDLKYYLAHHNLIFQAFKNRKYIK